MHHSGTGSGSFGEYALVAVLFVYGGMFLLWLAAKAWRRIEAKIRAHYAPPLAEVFTHPRFNNPVTPLGRRGEAG